MPENEKSFECKTEEARLQEIKDIYALQKEGIEVEGMESLSYRELFLFGLVEMRSMTLKHENEMHELYKSHYERVQKQSLLLGKQRLLAVAALAFCAKSGGMDAEGCKELLKQIQALEDEVK